MRCSFFFILSIEMATSLVNLAFFSNRWPKSKTESRPVGTGTVLKLRGPVKEMFARLVTGGYRPLTVYKKQ